ncbi:MAG: histidinol-phosphate transaminase, partial [Propionibacteriaceae bacterium]
MTGTASPSLADLPLRPELVGEVPYGAPQLDVPYCLNVNENPYPPSEQVVADIAAAVAEAARG